VPCSRIDLKDGTRVIVCTRGQRARRCSMPGCGRPATKLCDFPLRGRRAGKTCDKAVCDAHAHPQGRHRSGPHHGDSIDYCPAHHAQAKTQLELEDLK
jgi:hypothetical protein